MSFSRRSPVRPLNLEIEGFTAFRERQTVDFEPLELFVITGPTGAGKTSILDAMVFALYGQVPRLGGKHGTTDLVSLGKVESRVKLEFSLDGKGRYRVARRLSRRAAQSATLERYRDGEWTRASDGGVTECNSVLRELLGLDFDSFCKAVVLPQGEFHKFLKGDPNERRRVLVALLGVGYFQKMGDIARARGKDLAAGVKRTEEILADQYADATEEHVQQLRHTAKAAAERAAVLNASLRDAERRAAEAAEHERRGNGLAGQSKQLIAIGAELEGEVAACREAEESWMGAAKALADAEGMVAAARSAASAADSRARELEAELGTIGQLAGLAAAAENMRAAQTERLDAEVALARAEEELAAATLAMEADEHADAKARGAVAEARTARDASATNAQETAKRATDLAQAVTDAEDRAVELDAAREKHSAAEAAASDTQAAAEQARGQLEMAVEHLEHHRHANAVAELAHGLSTGDPCPVCTRPLSEPVAVADDASEALELARTAESDARAKAEKASALAAELIAAARAAGEQVPIAERRLCDAVCGRTDIGVLRADAKAASAASAEAESELTAVATALQDAEAAQSETGKRLLTATGELKRCEAVAESAKRTLASIDERLSKAAETLSAYFGQEPPQDASEQIEERRARVHEATQAARSAQAELSDLIAACDLRRADSDTAQKRLGELDVTLAGLRTRAEAATRGSNELLGETDTVNPPPALAATRDASMAVLADWTRETTATVGVAARTAEETAAKIRQGITKIATDLGFDTADGQAATEPLRDAERQAANDAVRAENDVDQAARRAEERAQLAERVRAEREQIAVLTTLAQELRADRFSEYIVQETLELLAAHASEELLRISDGRYSLVPVEADFHVVDHHNADERRSVKTLSGGETFLASLALALALSRHVGDLAREGLGAKLEAVFIDEGFGALDPETLEEVIDALERLRAEELLVGVISHVPVLAERIRSGLEVSTDQGHSAITPTIATRRLT
jgi:exonuclease SbcC